MLKNVSLVFLGNALSKILGAGREVLSAAFFGTGAAMGAFRVGLTATLVPANFFTSDALNSAFIPLYKRFAVESKDRAQTLLWALGGLFGLISLLIGLCIWLWAVSWIRLLAPGIDQETAILATNMLHVMGIGVPFYLASALVMFLGMANDDFVPMTLRPVFQNLGLIAGVIAAYLFHNLTLLAWGFTASYMAFSAWVLCRAARADFLNLPGYWDWPQVSDVLRAFWACLRPLVLLPFMLQGNVVIERMVASFIGLAAISALDYARFVTDTLIFLISVPVGFAGLAHWSDLSADAMRDHLHKILMLMLLLAVPASAFLSVHATLVVEALYARGAFDAESVAVTSDILFGAAVGLWAQVFGYVLIKGLSAQLRNRAVFGVMICALFVNSIVNLLLYKSFGAMALGFGNAAYGLVLLMGTVTALGLWRPLLVHGWVIVPSVFGYVVLSTLLPLPESVGGGMVIASGFAVIYWISCIFLTRSLRSVVLTALKYELR